jgi:hypothetical protein
MALLLNPPPPHPVLGISDPPGDCEEPSPTIGPPMRLPLADPVCFGPLVAVAVFLFIIGIIVGCALVIGLSLRINRRKQEFKPIDDK